MTNREHATSDGMQPSLPGPALDRPAPEPGCEQLPPRDAAVLGVGDRRDDGIGRSRSTFAIHVKANVDLGASRVCGGL